MKRVKVFLLRRWYMVGGAALVLAAAIFYVVSYPASVSTAASARQLPIYSVERSQRVCSISFDAAWGNEDTQTLIDILEKFHVKTTFFVVGDWAEKYPESVKALHDAGHEVMSHSNHHDHFNSLSADQIVADVTASNERIAAASGVTPTLIRCPYGEYDDHVISAIRSMGMESPFSGMWSNRKRLKAVVPQRFTGFVEMRISQRIDLQTGCFTDVSGAGEVKFEGACARCRCTVLRRGTDDAESYLYQFVNTFTSRRLL